MFCIHLLGRWWSDKMLCYLHVQAYPVVAHLAPTMLHHGDFSFLPDNTVNPPTPLLPVLGGLQGPVAH